MLFVFALAFVLNLVAVFYVIVTSRPLVSEGSWFLYRNLKYLSTSVGGNHKRYLAGLWELPNVLFAKIGIRYDVDLTNFILFFWSACISFLPIVSIFILYKYLKSRGQTHFIAFPIISYGLATMVALVYASNPLFEVHIIFWIIGTIFLFSDFKSKHFWIAFIPLIIAFSISHELAMVLCVPLLLGLFIRLRGRKIDIQISLVIIAVCISGLFSFYRSQTGGYPNQVDQISIALQALSDFQPQIALVFLTIVAVSFRSMPFRSFVLISLSVSTMALIWYSISERFGILVSYLNGRHISIILASVLYLLFVLYATVLKSVDHKKISFVAALAILLGSGLDIFVTTSWLRGKNNLQELRQQFGPGCHVIDYNTFQKNLAPYGLEAWQLPIQTMLLEKSRVVTQIFFSPHPQAAKFSILPLDICDQVKTKNTFYFFADQPFLPDKYFSYTFLNATTSN